MKRITTVVSGNIQNVGYRAKVITIARAFGLTGNVQNLEDGRVKIIAEGEEDYLNRFVGAITIKNALIDVTDVETEYSEPTGDYADFYKLVGEGETDERLDKAADYLKEIIVVMKGGFENLNSKMEIMIEKQDIMIEKQDMMIEKQEQTIDEIRDMRGDLKSYMEWKHAKLESELDEKLERGFDEIKSALKEHGVLC